MDEDLRNEIVTRGGLVPLLRLSSSDDVEIQMEVRMYEHTLGKPGGQGFFGMASDQPPPQWKVCHGWTVQRLKCRPTNKKAPKKINDKHECKYKYNYKHKHKYI